MTPPTKTKAPRAGVTAATPRTGSPDAPHAEEKPTLAFLAAANKPEAQAALAKLQKRYGAHNPKEADILIVLGGDGWMLRSLHANMSRDIPLYGMNRGGIGFLMNAYQENDLLERLARAVETRIHPLEATLALADGTTHTARAINEVSLLRSSQQAAKIRVEIDGKTRLDALIGDGILLATPAGSTAYNLSVHGPILPMDAPLLALTPISAFRPRRWHGALLPQSARVRLEALNPDARPIQASADHQEFSHVTAVEIRADLDKNLRLLFDPEHSWEERILREQFQF